LWGVGLGQSVPLRWLLAELGVLVFLRIDVKRPMALRQVRLDGQNFGLGWL